MQAALPEALEEGRSVDLSFAQGDTDAEQGAFAIRGNAQGDEDGTFQDMDPVADLFEAGNSPQFSPGRPALR